MRFDYICLDLRFYGISLDQIRFDYTFTVIIDLVFASVVHAFFLNK